MSILNKIAKYAPPALLLAAAMSIGAHAQTAEVAELQAAFEASEASTNYIFGTTHSSWRRWLS